MKRERDAIQIMEEAVNLLRSAPLSTVVVYLTGAIPFTLALLFFLTDMTHSPFAAEHLGTASLGVALLYVWKNAWQAAFAGRLLEMLSPGSMGAGSTLRMIAIQSALQPLGIALTLPFPWLVAFFRNVALFAALGVPRPMKTASRQAVLWPGQSWAVLALTAIAALLLFVNCLIVIVLLPQLAKTFLGIEGDFARIGAGILNVTTLAVAAAVTWLVIDPLLDAVYVLRCFYGESITTGEDLRAALRRAVAVVAMLAAMLAIAPSPVLAQSIDPVKLERSMDEVIHQREFTWRAPRPAGQEPEGRWVGWVRSAEDMLVDVWDWITTTIRRWLEQKPGTEAEGGAGAATRRMLQLLIGLTVALVAGAAVLFFTRRRGPVVAASAVTTAAPAVNLADESVTADQLPESSWMKLADEWLAKGDCRRALRALYLAGLNHLGERGMVSIRRWKSGLDYKRELERRTRAKPGMSPLFRRNVDLFERGWYGHHAVDRGMVEAFAAGLSEMREL